MSNTDILSIPPPVIIIKNDGINNHNDVLDAVAIKKQSIFATVAAVKSIVNCCTIFAKS